MHLAERIRVLVELGKYMAADEEAWEGVRRKAHAENAWFEPAFIQLAVQNIVEEFLQEEKLLAWTKSYGMPAENPQPRTIGIVMAGNIPLVGFHDFLATFVTGNRQLIKPSARDRILIEHLAHMLNRLAGQAEPPVSLADRLNGCDAYIATGSNNSARYFEYYFGKYPNLIRRNRTSVAILRGKESPEELCRLAGDVHQYFGLGCRNVTQVLVPAGYDFTGLLEAFSAYDWMAGHHKYRNNYDYQLALLILNRKYYMTNGSILLTEEQVRFSPIAVLNYQFYQDEAELAGIRPNEGDIQTVAGAGFTPFGQTQRPRLADYADGLDTIRFLLGPGQ